MTMSFFARSTRRLLLITLVAAAAPAISQIPRQPPASSAPDKAADADVASTHARIWELLAQSHWISDGRSGARVVYVFTDPNCPYCNKLWVDARPWVATGKVELRHVIVGVLTETSPGKAAALLAAKDPAAALTAHEREHEHAMSEGRRPRPLEGGSLQPLKPIPAKLQRELDDNQRLMAGLGFQATPAIVWRGEDGQLQGRQGIAPGELAKILGPR